jgi:type II secretory pathway component PulF
MFAGDLDSVLNPIITLGIGGLIGGIFVLAVAVSIYYIVYMQSNKDRNEH